MLKDLCVYVCGGWYWKLFLSSTIPNVFPLISPTNRISREKSYHETSTLYGEWRREKLFNIDETLITGRRMPSKNLTFLLVDRLQEEKSFNLCSFLTCLMFIRVCGSVKELKIENKFWCQERAQCGNGTFLVIEIHSCHELSVCVANNPIVEAISSSSQSLWMMEKLFFHKIKLFSLRFHSLCSLELLQAYNFSPFFISISFFTSQKLILSILIPCHQHGYNHYFIQLNILIIDP